MVGESIVVNIDHATLDALITVVKDILLGALQAQGFKCGVVQEALQQQGGIPTKLLL